MPQFSWLLFKYEIHVSLSGFHKQPRLDADARELRETCATIVVSLDLPLPRPSHARHIVLGAVPQNSAARTATGFTLSVQN